MQKCDKHSEYRFAQSMPVPTCEAEKNPLDYSHMHQLDQAALLTLDKSNMLGSVASLSEQIRHAWETTQSLPRPVVQGKIDAIAVFGMGGSGLGIHVVQTVFRDSMQVPVQVINDYSVPAWIDDHTLVVLSSYSGTTEETLEATRVLMKRTKHIAVITAGGALKDLIAQGVLGYVIDPQYNPCKQPRMAIGYSVFGILGLLERFGMVHITQHQVDKVCERVEQVIQMCGPQVEFTRNPAKQLIEKLEGHFIWLLGSEHLLGAVHVATNQLNENGKCLAAYYAIPEANHHLMEGLSFPAELVRQVVAVGFISKNYHPRNQVRYMVTARVLQRAQIACHLIEIPLGTALEEIAWLLAFSGYASVYAALQYGVDPSPIPNVDFFKEQLAKVK